MSEPYVPAGGGGEGGALGDGGEGDGGGGDGDGGGGLGDGGGGLGDGGGGLGGGGLGGGGEGDGGGGEGGGGEGGLGDGLGDGDGVARHDSADGRHLDGQKRRRQSRWPRPAAAAAQPSGFHTAEALSYTWAGNLKLWARGGRGRVLGGHRGARFDRADARRAPRGTVEGPEGSTCTTHGLAIAWVSDEGGRH